MSPHIVFFLYVYISKATIGLNRCNFYIVVILAFDGNGQPVAHSEHAQFDPLVLVQLLIESIQTLRGDVSRSRIHNISAPQHLEIHFSKRLFYSVHSLNMLSKKKRFGCVRHAYVVNRNDAPFSYELKGLLIVSVIVEFISIDEHKVEGSCLPACYQCI